MDAAMSLFEEWVVSPDKSFEGSRLEELETFGGLRPEELVIGIEEMEALRGDDWCRALQLGHELVLRAIKDGIPLRSPITGEIIKVTRWVALGGS